MHSVLPYYDSGALDRPIQIAPIRGDDTGITIVTVQSYRARVRSGFGERLGCRSRSPRPRTRGHTGGVMTPNSFGSWNFILLYALVRCTSGSIHETHRKCSK